MSNALCVNSENQEQKMNPQETDTPKKSAEAAPGEGNLMAVQERLGLFAGQPAAERIQAALEEKPLALV
jgi:hypothetical protein